MALQTTTQLKKWFGTGCYPTGAQFADLIDSLRHKADTIELSEVEGLCTALNGRAGREELVALQRAIEGLQTGVKALGYAVKDGGSAIIRFSGFIDGELGHPCGEIFTEEQIGEMFYHRTWQRFIEVVAADDWEYAEVADPVPGFFYVNEDALYIGVAGEERNGLVEMTALLALAADVRDNVARSRVITLTRVADLRYSWSGAALGDIRQGDILTWTDTDEMFRAVVFGERTSGTRREVCAMFTRDGDEAIEFSLLWFHENGEAYETVFDSSQTLAWQFAACQKKLTDTADIQVRAEARPSGQHYTPYGLYLKDSAKRAVFNDMFNLAAGSDGGYKPSEAPDPAKPYLLNTLWLSYEEAEREMLDYTSIITFWKRAIRRSGLNVFCIGSFDETTRTGTLNGISGLSLSEMTDILLAGNPTAAGAAYHFAFNPFIRTNLWQMWYMDGTVAGQKCFYKCANIEVACASYLRVGTDTFSHCPKLHTIIGPLYGDGNNPAPFRGCASLVNLPGFGWNGNLDISDSPLLSLASVSALIDKGKEGATITVHADVFAKLTGDCDGVTMVITAPTTRDKSAVPIVIANPGMFAVSDILTAPVITGDDGLPLRLTVTAVDAEGQPSVAPINAGALGGLSGCNIMLADSEPAQWAAVLNAAYAKNISFATD